MHPIGDEILKLIFFGLLLPIDMEQIIILFILNLAARGSSLITIHVIHMERLILLTTIPSLFKRRVIICFSGSNIRS